MNPFVNIHTHNNHIDNKEFIEIKNIGVDGLVNVDVPFLYSVGIHPWDVDYGQQMEVGLGEFISQSISDLNFLAIGECGLDRVCSSDFETQKCCFIKQIEMSEIYHKPMIIHSVKTHSDIISIRKETKAKMPWIIHGFQGNGQTVSQLLRHDIYLSLGEVLFRNEIRAAELLKLIPSERLFLETDDSERSIVDVYEKASVLSGRSLDDLRNDIFNNFVKIFGKI